VASQPTQEQEIRVRIPPGFKVLRENILVLFCHVVCSNEKRSMGHTLKGLRKGEGCVHNYITYG
jgi:hypothetical protein